jgi:hypothetical protein
MGLQRLRGAIAGGQYAFPQGLFFGGKEACKSTQIVKEHCDTWVGTSRDVLHLDVHSGLGPFGSYKMLLTDRADSEGFAWYAETFGAERVEALVEADETSERVAFPVSGLFGRWMQNHFDASNYWFAAAEFGTHRGIRVLGALRAENRAHHHCALGDPQLVRAKREILECFCPRAPDWRRRVVCSGLEIIERGSRALLEPGV